jgi:hypothetical protein
VDSTQAQVEVHTQAQEEGRTQDLVEAPIRGQVVEHQQDLVAVFTLDLGVDSTQAQEGVHTQAQEEGQAQALEVGVTPVLAEVILTSGIDPTQIAGEL